MSGPEYENLILRLKYAELLRQYQNALAEIVRLRRWIERLECPNDASENFDAMFPEVGQFMGFIEEITKKEAPC